MRKFTFGGIQLICCTVGTLFLYSQAANNLALNKKATQSSTYHIYYASLAVDGNYSQQHPGCAHTYHVVKQTVAWWQVDLQNKSAIKFIKIYYRSKTIRRLNGFEVYFDDWRNNKPCYKDTEDGYPPSIIIVNCTGLARYVTIVNYNYTEKDKDHGPILELCEVEVFGCAEKTFGLQCEFSCHCLEGTCNGSTGICEISGCEPRWEGESCNIACDENTFGLQCGFNCHCLNGSCDHVNGTCDIPGCLPGWKGDSCNTTCVENKFGLNCGFTCHCLNGSCDHVGGTCDIPGCKPGWKNETCSIPCESNAFGFDCNSTCNCDRSSCDRFNGKCEIPVCKAGWLGKRCDEQCENGKFGYDCLKSCHCLKGDCNHENGTCYIQGCKEGWTGESCNVSVFEQENLSLNKNATQSTTHADLNANLAVDGILSQYLYLCTHTIYDPKQKVAWWQVDLQTKSEIKYIKIYYRDETRWKLNGFEVYLDDWEGSEPCYKDTEEGYPPSIVTVNCTGLAKNVIIVNYNYTKEDEKYGPILELCEVQVIGCLKGYYGGMCGKQCSSFCNDSRCDLDTGLCLEGCTSDNRFGPDCTVECHCRSEGCHHTNGTCFVPGCKTGWHGNSCEKPCNENSFGLDCNSTCHCLHGTCHHINGTCATPKCKPGWKGETCSTPCGNNTFGLNCESTCHCNKSGCNNVDGKCIIPECIIGWKGDSCNQSMDNKSLSDPPTGSIGIAVGGVAAGLLVFGGVIIVICVYRKRRQNSSNTMGSKDDISDHVYDDLESTKVGDTSGYEVMNMKKEERFEMGNLDVSSSSYTINLDNLYEVIAQNVRNGEFENQYKSIPNGALYPQNVGKRVQNKKKNRHQAILPYDHSRVILDAKLSSDQNDYINASYIKGYFKDANYIATQGPLKNTIEDFWRMIWQEKSGKIVMLSKSVREAKHGCTEYLPVAENVLVAGDFAILMIKDIKNPEFVTRQLKLTNTKTGEVRLIWHFQFTSWPENVLPNLYQLVLFHRHYKETKSKQSGPPVIHCSDGVDQTGMFVALDAGVDYAKRNSNISIYTYIRKMRENRMNMIPTKEQYIFLHEALSETITFQETSIKKDEFLTTMGQDSNRIENEFENLSRKKPHYDETFYKEALGKKNKPKNRTQNILPVEMFRPDLAVHGKLTLNYINAVIVPSCKVPKGFLATQFPLENTIADLWSMVFQHESSTIVTLDEIPMFQKVMQWYPKNEEKMHLGNLSLSKTSESFKRQQTKEVLIRIADKESSKENIVRVFEYLNWKNDSGIPTSKSSFAELITSVQRWNKSIRNAPITVVCSDGTKCCGLFCLAYSVLEMLGYNEDIDIYKTARIQRLRRPEFLSLEQYKFCYSIVQDCITDGHRYSEIS